MAKTKTPKIEDSPSSSDQMLEKLAEAIARSTTAAIDIARPIPKKTVFTRRKNTPWTDFDENGKPLPKVKLKRKFYQHNVLVPDNMLNNEETSLANKLKPGAYCNGFVQVIRRKDKGINIDYPVKTASQRLRLINEFGVRSLKELLETCVNEAKAPKKPEIEDLD